MIGLQTTNARATGWLEESLYQQVGERALGWVCRRLVRAAAGLMFRIDLVQHAPLPPGPKIIAPNHPSTTDPFLMTILAEERISILIDNTLFKVPIFGGVLRALGHVPVVPGQGRTAFDAARARLLSGGAVSVFPEGSVSPLEGGFHRPRTGVARLALITGAPVIPVGIHLVRERIRLVETEVDGRLEVGTWYTDGPYAITVGAPMHLRGQVEDRAQVRALSQSIMHRIAHLTGESEQRILQGPSAPGSAVAPEVVLGDAG